MTTKQTTILNKTGLHARPASSFVEHAKQYKSNVEIVKLDAEGNEVKVGPAKSIVYLMAMQLTKGTRVEIRADGEDETLAVDNLVALIESGFGEL